MKMIPYLVFNGTAEAAMEFYQEVLGGKTEMTRFSEMPPDPDMSVSEEWANKVMHGSLTTDGGLELFFSDTFEGMPATIGDNVTVHIEVDSEEQSRKVFDALSDGAEITMPLEKVFWGAVYGSLIDRFGVSWGVNFQIPS